MGTIVAPSSFRNALCADFNGTDEYAFRDDPSFKANTAGAWSFWIKMDAVFGVDGADSVFGYGVRSAGNNAQMLFGPRRVLSTTGANTFMSITHRPTNAGTISGFSGTTTALTAGVWHHCVVQSNGTAWSMWVDGVSQTMTQWNVTGSNNGDWYGDVSGTDHRFVAGVNYMQNAIGAGFYAGLLDEAVYIAGRVFTSGEVASLYNSGTRTNPRKIASIQADIAAWYRFGDSRDNATTIFDEVGSNDLTLVNMDASNYVAP